MGPDRPDKPRDYYERRKWQNAARARGEVPECGREACHNKASPAWVNQYTPLLYCRHCAQLLNELPLPDGSVLCSPENN